MTRRRWLIVQLVCAAALVTLALPSKSLALSASFISLTSSGPSPATAVVPADMYPVWENDDTVSHTIAFPTGCSAEIAPGGYAQCAGPWGIVGTYAYTVDGTTQASLKVVPGWRAVTLTAKSHAFDRGSRVLLRGTLEASRAGPQPIYGPKAPVRVFERPRGHHLWYPIGVVMATPAATQSPIRSYSVWRLWVRPHDGTAYMVEASSQPKAGKHWQTAWSSAFELSARR